MAYVMFVHGLATGEPLNAFLAAFDVDAMDGIGSARLTGDIQQALRFPDHSAVIDAWMRQSTVRPLRADGKPNRPLTAYTIEPMRIAADNDQLPPQVH